MGALATLSNKLVFKHDCASADEFVCLAVFNHYDVVSVGVHAVELGLPVLFGYFGHNRKLPENFRMSVLVGLYQPTV